MEFSLRKVGPYLAAGFASQGVAALTGLLLVRWMTLAEYALYTVAVTMLGAITLLTRSGVQMGLAAALAKTWPDRPRSAAALASTQRVRLLVSALTMPMIVLISWVLLARAGAGAGVSLGICAILALLWLADLGSAVRDQVLNFAGRANEVQTLDTGLALFRVCGVIALRLAGALSVTTALVTSLTVSVLRILPISRKVRALFGDRAIPPDPALTRDIQGIALRQVPVDLFTLLQTQVSLFFLTAQTGGEELATYGALGRIALLLAPFAGLSAAFFVPAFAPARDRIVARIARFVVLGSIPALVLVAIAVIAPGALLLLIGPAYADRSADLIVCAATVALSNAVQIAWNLVTHRGWNRRSWLRIPLGLAWLATGPFVLPLQTVSGAYLFYCGFALANLAAIAWDLVTAQREEGIALFGPGRPAD